MTDEYITKDKAKELVCDFCQWAGTANCEECEHPVDDAPAADVVEVRRGKWIEENATHVQDGCKYCKCSICSEHIAILGHYLSYCPNCGAKMDAEAQE